MKYDSIYKDGMFKDKNFVITGGGSGIGRCTAHEIGSLGGDVTLIGRTEAKLANVKKEIEYDGGKASYIVCDVRDEEQVIQAVESIVSEKGVIHGLVNNAGGQFPANLVDLSKNGFESVLRSNVTAGFIMSREVYKQSMREHGGSIVNITMDHWNGLELMGHTSASRAAMDNLTKTQAKEWAPSGVRVNSVAPGLIASTGLDSYDKDEVTRWLKEATKFVPLKRFGSAAEVSATICFLLSRAAGFITGSSIRVDGAASLVLGYSPLPEVVNDTCYQGFHRDQIPEFMDGVDANQA